MGGLAGSSPAAWTVLVVADCGVSATWVFTTIQACGWHPYLRIKRQGPSCPAGKMAFRPLTHALSAIGQGWAGRVTCFATKDANARVRCWGAGMGATVIPG